MRATADNPDLALVSGIDTRRVIWATWAIGGGLAAIAGGAAGRIAGPVAAHHGMEVPDTTLCRSDPGGIGNPYGALGGAFIIGITSEVSTQWINPSYKPAVAFAIMIVMLLFRPRGLFGGSGSG